MDIDFPKLCRRLTPHFLRTTKVLEFIGVSCNDIAALHETFKTNRDARLEKLQFTGQTLSLEQRLNDVHSPTLGGIFIQNLNIDRFDFFYRKAENKDKRYIYRKSEGKPKTYLIRKSEINIQTFIIFIPTTVSYVEQEVRETADCYVVYGNNYTIQTY